jgi:hypothetical protein
MFVNNAKHIIMKQILPFALLLLISLLAFNSNAQDLPKAPSSKVKYSLADPTEKAKSQTDKLKEQLDLNDEQYEQILRINIDAAKQNKFSGTPEAIGEQIKQLQLQRRAAILGWLNDKQTKLYNQLYPLAEDVPAQQTGNVNTISVQPIKP